MNISILSPGGVSGFLKRRPTPTMAFQQSFLLSMTRETPGVCFIFSSWEQPVRKKLQQVIIIMIVTKFFICQI